MKEIEQKFIDLFNIIKEFVKKKNQVKILILKLLL